MRDLEQLIPDLLENFGNVDTWLLNEGRMDHAFAYASIFWPDFKIHEGCVLFEDCDTESFEHWMHATNNNLTATESVLNHKHIGDLFWGDSATAETMVAFANLLQEVWACKLKRDFPDHNIVVSAYETDTDPQITFFHER